MIWVGAASTASFLAHADRLGALLSNDEQARMRQYHFARDRSHYLVRTALLRILLGRALDRPPDQIELARTRLGKPHLVPAGALEFNLSHSGDWAAFAFSPRRRVGVDIEQPRPLPDRASIAQRVLTPGEQATLDGLTDSDAERRLLQLWTRKEAAVKAMGAGLTEAMNSFEVLGAALPSTCVVSLAGDSWSVQDLSLDPHVAAALCFERRPDDSIEPPEIEIHHLQPA